MLRRTRLCCCSVFLATGTRLPRGGRHPHSRRHRCPCRACRRASRATWRARRRHPRSRLRLASFDLGSSKSGMTGTTECESCGSWCASLAHALQLSPSRPPALSPARSWSLLLVSVRTSTGRLPISKKRSATSFLTVSVFLKMTNPKPRGCLSRPRSTSTDSMSPYFTKKSEISFSPARQEQTPARMRGCDRGYE
eukprot:SAG22_NODE_4676_length_1196_cov_0.939836_1_plen_195_part_00